MRRVNKLAKPCDLPAQEDHSNVLDDESKQSKYLWAQEGLFLEVTSLNEPGMLADTKWFDDVADETNSPRNAPS